MDTVTGYADEIWYSSLTPDAGEIGKDKFVFHSIKREDKDETMFCTI